MVSYYFLNISVTQNIYVSKQYIYVSKTIIKRLSTSLTIQPLTKLCYVYNLKNLY